MPAWLPKVAGRKLFQEYYLAVDDAGAVRGGYILKHQEFWIQRPRPRLRRLPTADLRRRRSTSGLRPGRRATAPRRHRPAALALRSGHGRLRRSRRQLLEAAGWSMFSVPFFFRVVHPSAFLRNMTLPAAARPPVRWRSTPWRYGTGMARHSRRAGVPPPPAPARSSALPSSRSTSSPPGPTNSGRTARASTACRPCATPRPCESCIPRTIRDSSA